MDKILASVIRITTFTGIAVVAATLFLLPGTLTKRVHANPNCNDICSPNGLSCNGGCACLVSGGGDFTCQTVEAGPRR